MTLHLLFWSGFLLCLALSFVLSGMEAGVFALSRLRIRQQMRAGLPSAKLLHNYLENPENFLWTILVGNTLANLLILGWLVITLLHLTRSNLLWFVPAYTFLVVLFYALFDLLPKMLFRSYPTRLCLLLAYPFRLIHVVLRPAVALMEWVSGLLLRWRGGHAFTGRLFGNREELRFLMQESAQLLTSEERNMINRVLDLQSLTVRQVMKPLNQAVTVPASAPITEALRLSRETHLTRLPVWANRDNQQRIIGLLTVNTLLYQANLDMTRSAGDYVRPAIFLDESLRLEVALRRLQRSGQRLAIVLRPDRRESGIITLQDMLKVIFGEVSL